MCRGLISSSTSSITSCSSNNSFLPVVSDESDVFFSLDLSPSAPAPSSPTLSDFERVLVLSPACPTNNHELSATTVKDGNQKVLPNLTSTTSVFNKTEAFAQPKTAQDVAPVPRKSALKGGSLASRRKKGLSLSISLPLALAVENTEDLTEEHYGSGELDQMFVEATQAACLLVAPLGACSD